jgi:preprotein translocase subunit YajC
MSPEALQQILFFGLIALTFYFFMIRPQQQRTADQKKFREALQKGQSVQTIGGLHGRVVEITEKTVVLEVDKGVRLTFEKASIAATPAAEVAKS